ncbi:MAG: hypothetical protein KDI44_05905 [Thiothrix sp.]|nr:hypothetical protein [Thiothrix sp.]HPQ94795.1 hypothetical protein [Thiolinea sp.]
MMQFISHRIASHRIASHRRRGYYCKFLSALMVFSAVMLAGCNDGDESLVDAYGEQSTRSIPGPVHVLYPPPEGYYTEEMLRNWVDVPPPVEAILDKDPAQRSDYYSNRLTFANVQYVANGGQMGGNLCRTFPAEARQSVQAALNIWGAILNSPQPVTVRACWSLLASGAAAMAGATELKPITLDGVPLWVPIALANAVSNRDLNTADVDFEVTVDAGTLWHYDPQVLPPSTRLDLTSALLHELGHGLGINTFASRAANGVGSWLYPSSVSSYDQFLRLRTTTQSGTAVLQNLRNVSLFPNGSLVLGNAFVSDQVFFAGSRAMAANNGQPVRLQASTARGAAVPVLP